MGEALNVTTVVVIQARMGSSRLPGKSLAALGSSTVLDWVVRRCRLAEHVDEVIVATTTEVDDDPIAERLAVDAVPCVRGHTTDVLSRYALALDSTSADVIVRVTADCPFVDPRIIDAGVRHLRARGCDYASTSLDGRYPRGLDVEVIRRSTLQAAHREATDASEREHVTLFVYRRPTRFACEPIHAPGWARRPDLRFTIDEPDDLELARRVVASLTAEPELITSEQIVAFLNGHPDIAAINRLVEHRNMT